MSIISVRSYHSKVKESYCTNLQYLQYSGVGNAQCSRASLVSSITRFIGSELFMNAGCQSMPIAAIARSTVEIMMRYNVVQLRAARDPSIEKNNCDTKLLPRITFCWDPANPPVARDGDLFAF